MKTSRQKRRSKCIKTCSSNEGKRLGIDCFCNCSAKQLRVGHMQPGDHVLINLQRFDRACELDVFVMSDIDWGRDNIGVGCIPGGVSTMTRLLDTLGPRVIVPAMTPVYKVITEYSPKTLIDGDKPTDPLGGK